MADIAREAGVSIATVSRALSGRSGVSTATRRRIRRIAEDNRYQVSGDASALARGRNDRVAVVVPRVDSSVEVVAVLDTLPLRRKVDALGTEAARALLDIMEEDPRNDE
ncbi:LacI family DNA-binding transcriptional regulator [Rhodococcus pseudokoreensis]|nr:LacI family DNA-binding transcriptional regulator [Rhodococcus pseudokoreensis]